MTKPVVICEFTPNMSKLISQTIFTKILMIFFSQKKSPSVPDNAFVSSGQMNFFFNPLYQENILGFEYGFEFFEMAKVNTYNNENNGSCPVFCQYLFENLNFQCGMVDEKSGTDTAFHNCFFVHQSVLRFHCLTITQPKLILHSNKT